MQIVIDTNVILAMLAVPGKPLDVFFNDKLNIFAPRLLFEELENNKLEIIEKSRLTEEEFDWLYMILKHNIVVFSEEDFLSYREEADKICPDPKDIVYFALALYLRCPIWSNDKKLKEQNEVRIYATHELIEMLKLI